jgi:Uma2 family endonuclease
MATVSQAWTVDDLMRLGSDVRVEVVSGDMVEMTPVGGVHAFIVDNFYRLLYPVVSANKLGYVVTDSLIYILSAGTTGVRIARVPDVSFVRKESIPPDWDIERPFPGAPTLAVEVMSPDDQFEDVVAKVHDYFDANTEEVWVVLPRQKTIYRYRRGESQVQTYRGMDTIDASALFPGLVLALADVFALPDLG